jgi:zinc transport system substrate-binding protein
MRMIPSVIYRKAQAVRLTTRTTAVTAAVALALTACGAAGPAEPGQASDGGTTVVASFFPLAEAARKVGGDRVTVTNVTPVGADPHDVELSPTEVDAILQADLLLYQGRGFQPAVEAAMEQRDGRSVNVLEGLDLLEGVENGHEEEDDEHEGEDLDPHVWLDPLRYADIVERIGAALAEVDPEGTETYRANAEAHRERIRALHDSFDRRLSECDRELLVVSHAAFGYLADRYGLHQEPVAGLSPESEPDPRRLSELIALVREEGVTTVFTETLVSPDVARTLAREAGVSTAVLNPLEGLTDQEETAGETYLSIMERNLETIAAALDC